MNQPPLMIPHVVPAGSVLLVQQGGEGVREQIQAQIGQAAAELLADLVNQDVTDALMKAEMIGVAQCQRIVEQIINPTLGPIVDVAWAREQLLAAMGAHRGWLEQELAQRAAAEGEQPG